MPYIAIKAFPKDEETVKAVVENLNQALIDTLGCPPEAVSVSYEEVQPDDWKEQVIDGDMAAKADYMMIRDGEKLY